MGLLAFRTQVKAPSITSIASTSSSQLDIFWSLPGAFTISLTELERSANGTSGWTQVYSGTALTFASSGLTANTTYYYRARVKDSQGNYSPYSSTSSQTTQQPPNPAGVTVLHYDDFEVSHSYVGGLDMLKTGETGFTAVRWTHQDDYSALLDSRPAYSTNRARFGTGSARFQLTKGSDLPNPTQYKITGGTQWPHRTQILSKPWPSSAGGTGWDASPDVGKEYWYGFSIYLPGTTAFGDPVFVAGSPGAYYEIFMQIHDNPDAGDTNRNPMITLNIFAPSSGASFTNWMFNIKSQSTFDSNSIPGGPRTYERNSEIDLGAIAGDIGHWTDWVMRVKYDYFLNAAAGSHGFVQLWKNGVMAYSEFQRGNCFNDTAGRRFDLGYYTSPSDNHVDARPSQRVFYIDEEKVAEVSGNAEVSVGVSNAGYIAVAPRGTRT